VFVGGALHAAMHGRQFFKKILGNARVGIVRIGFPPIELNTKMGAAGSATDTRIVEGKIPPSTISPTLFLGV
jgi:hypothetical protein